MKKQCPFAKMKGKKSKVLLFFIILSGFLLGFYGAELFRKK